ILKQSFAPQLDQEETKRSYLDLIYGNSSDDNNTNNSSSSISNDDNILHSGVRRYWQYAYRQFH
ncbi:30662_t:CDS:1, partial [Racocetra persica]